MRITIEVFKFKDFLPDHGKQIILFEYPLWTSRIIQSHKTYYKRYIENDLSWAYFPEEI